MRAVIISADKKFKKDGEVVKKTLKKLERLLGLKDKYVEVYLIKDNFNVHSFEAAKDFPRPDLRGRKNLGEIYLCPDYIRGEALDSGSTSVETSVDRSAAGMTKGGGNDGEATPNILGSRTSIGSPISGGDEKIIFMLVHGFLHLLGYDHKKKSDRIKMENKEKELMQKIL